MVLDFLKEDIEIQSISTANLGVKFDNHWCNVDGKVWSFFKDAKPGDKYKVKVNDANTIVYAVKLESKPSKADKPKAKEITYTDGQIILAQVCLKVAGNLTDNVEDCKKATKELYKWMYDGGFKEV